MPKILNSKYKASPLEKNKTVRILKQNIRKPLRFWVYLLSSSSSHHVFIEIGKLFGKFLMIGECSISQVILLG